MYTWKRFCLLVAIVLVLSIVMAACDADLGVDIGGIVDPLPSATGGSQRKNDNELSLGRLEGGVYTNKYIGIACELDSSWTYYGADELQELPGKVEDMFEDSVLGDAINNMERISDMMAESVEDMTTINILLQKLTLQDRLAYAGKTEKEIIDLTLEQRDLMIDSYEQAGIYVSSITTKKVTFLGEERIAIYTVSQMNGVAYYVLQLFEFDLGAYSATLTFASFVEDKTESLLDLFYAVS